jgi:hypothetical protein
VKLSRYGIEIDLPRGWEGRIYRRPEGRPILHAGNFQLPAEDGDFGTGAVSAMGDGGVFFVLAEYDPEAGGSGLFSHRGVPGRLEPSEASPRALIRALPGRRGIQRFFTVRGRAFCLYLVAAERPSAARLVDEANRVLRSVSIEAE